MTRNPAAAQGEEMLPCACHSGDPYCPRHTPLPGEKPAAACTCDPVRPEGKEWFAHQPGCPLRGADAASYVPGSTHHKLAVRIETLEARLAQAHEAMEFIAAHPNGVGNHHPAFVARRWLAGKGDGE